MRRNRIILAVLWIISLVGISFYGGLLSYGFFMVITLLPLVSFGYLLLVLSRFKIYQHFECPEIVCNHVVPFYFTLQNEDYFMFSGVRVTFYSDFSVIDGLSDDIEYELLPKTKIKKETELICRYRGEYPVGIRSVTLRDFLCLFQITTKNREPLRATVLPDIIMLDSLVNIETEAFSASETSAAPAFPDVTVRDYIPGDDIRRIHWKQSARTGKLCVRTEIGEEKDGVGVILDTARLSSDPAVFLPVENRILEIAIALALFLQGKRIPVSAYWDRNGTMEYKLDPSESFDSFYREMCTMSFDASCTAEQLFGNLTAQRSVFFRRSVFVISADAGEQTLDFCKSLNDNGIDVIICLVKDQDGGALPYYAYPHTKVCTIPTQGELAAFL